MIFYCDEDVVMQINFFSIDLDILVLIYIVSLK